MNDNSGIDIWDMIQCQIPKVELHAHLNGCISSKVLHQLAQERNVTILHHQHVDDNNSFNTEVHAYTINGTTATSTSKQRRLHQRRTLQDCFDIFAELPKVITDLQALEIITKDALHQFAYEHHTVYLELRTTPKRLLHVFNQPTQATKKEYIDTIVRVVQEFELNEQLRYQKEMQQIKTQQPEQRVLIRLPMTCRINISVDRSQSIDEAIENIELAIDYFTNSNGSHKTIDEDEETPAVVNYVVGVDLGGNPHKQDFTIFQDVFQKARNAGLKVTIHCAEIECTTTAITNNINSVGSNDSGDNPSKEYIEAKAILFFRPDRLGHAMFLPKDLVQLLNQYQIPVETCPTSNVMTCELYNRSNNQTNDDSNNDHEEDWAVQALREHHTMLKYWIQYEHPIIICTDDPGIFDTNITRELYMVQQAYQLSISDIVQLSINAMQYAFCSEKTKVSIQTLMRSHCKMILESNSR